MTTRAPLDRFETALLAELRRDVARRAAVSARRPGRRLAVAAAGGAVAATVAVGGLVLRPDAAFAVDPQPDGDVVVTLTSLEDADGLEQALADEGVDAEVSYDADAPAPPEGDFALEDEQTDTGTGSRGLTEEGEPPDDDACVATIGVEMADDEVTFRLSADAVDSDAVLHITTSGDADDWTGLSVRWDEAPC